LLPHYNTKILNNFIKKPAAQAETTPRLPLWSDIGHVGIQRHKFNKIHQIYNLF